MMESPAADRRRWSMSLVGLALFVFAMVALSGPGRIDIVDGQTRFAVGQSLLEHGDSVVRDERIWWGLFPGRDGKNYTYYRIPQSLVATCAIAIVSATGPASEGRQHFFFLLSGAVACGLLSIVYAIWFRQSGCRPNAAILWAFGGIVCTPSWFYGTSTFDDILGTTVVVSAVAVAYRSRKSQSFAGAILAGLLLGVAYHCKQPLGAFALLALAAHDRRDASRRQRIAHAAVIVTGLFAGILTEKFYDWCKYPFDKNIAHRELLALYMPIWSDNPVPGLLTLTVSPAAGAPWYCPPLFIMLAGLLAWKRAGEARMAWTFAIGAVVFVSFISMLTFFKGDLCWGPRYLTPLFALGWLFVPAGARLLRPILVAVLLGLGFLVQILALSVDPHRLYVMNGLPGGISAVKPWIYFYPAVNHLQQRPREIWEIAGETEPAEHFTPSPSPTFAFPVVDPNHFAETGPAAVRRYRVLNSFRPWWISQQYLPLENRPVPIGKTAGGLGALALLGLLVVIVGTKSKHAAKV